MSRFQSLKLISVEAKFKSRLFEGVYFDQRFQRFSHFSNLWTIRGFPCPAPLDNVPFVVVDARFLRALGIHPPDDHPQHLGIGVQIEIRDLSGKNLPGESVLVRWSWKV